jgi:hypothetical protein
MLFLASLIFMLTEIVSRFARSENSLHPWHGWWTSDKDLRWNFISRPLLMQWRRFAPYFSHKLMLRGHHYWKQRLFRWGYWVVSRRGQTKSQFENQRENMLFYRGGWKILTLTPINGKIRKQCWGMCKGWKLSEN